MKFSPRFLILLSLCILTLPAAQLPRRLTSGIQDESTVRLAGHTKTAVATAQDHGELSSAQMLEEMALDFKPTAQQTEDLDQLLRQQQDHSSPQFHKFLTPEEYGARFGLHAADIAQVTAWLKSQGFSDVQVARSHTFVSFSGTAAQAQAAFRVSIHRYASKEGDHFYANTNDPLLPEELAGVVERVRGLDNVPMKSQAVWKAYPRYTSSDQNFYLVPDDLAVIYNIQPIYQAGFDGAGVKIAVVGQSNIRLTDIQAFRAAAGLPAKDPQVIVVGADPGLTADEREADLDIEYAGGVARNADIVFVTSPKVGTSIIYAVDNNVAPILSISYGNCETSNSSTVTAETTLFQQANAQGITVIAASGDLGPAACDSSASGTASHGLSVSTPADQPTVTGVGGTIFQDSFMFHIKNGPFGGSAVSYAPEEVWNDSNFLNPIAASGGGASVSIPKPAWQTGAGVPPDGMRDVPDVALHARPNYIICSAGQCINRFLDANSTFHTGGGTSAAAPAFAGIVALLVQALGPQGNINPQLYALAGSHPSAFHDITSGFSIIPCVKGTPACTVGAFGYLATPGYDQATGLGSVDAYSLFNAWNSNTPPPTGATQGPFTFIPMTPCRVVDTRNPTGAFGGPALDGKARRGFSIPAGPCNVPANAIAYALNVTVVPSGPLAYLSIWPTGQGQPVVSTLNSDGRIKANAAIVPAGSNGGVDVYVTNPTDLILDISGYFVPAAATISGLQFYPLPPCRLVDTRHAAVSLGGPFLSGGKSRDFPVSASTCNIPPTAQAYSLNFTVVPHAPLIYLAAWPTGQAQPPTSVVNAPNGTVTANAAMVPAGANGGITVLGSSDTELIMDINGYFAPPGTGGLNLYTITPCRVIDSRNPAGSAPLTGTVSVNVTTSGCGSPATAQAYALNATVVPSGPLTYLTLWPNNGDAPPVVSTLNADPNTVTSNMAILPSANGSVNAFAAGTTHLILDLSGYFAP